MNWPDLTFPPINLLSYQRMTKIEITALIANDIELDTDAIEYILCKLDHEIEKCLSVIRDVQAAGWEDFEVYCRTGKFPE